MIEHIFFAIFDNKIGAKLVVQEPEEFADEDTFKKISPFIITNPELCGQVISLRFGRQQIVHYSVSIDSTPGKSYERHRLQYSVGVVIPADEDHERYEMIVTKLALFLKKCEQEYDLIDDEEKFEKFKPQFKHIWKRLTQDGVKITFLLEKLKEVDTNVLKEAVENALPSECEKTCTMCHVDEITGRGHIVAEIWMPKYSGMTLVQTAKVHKKILETCDSKSTISNLAYKIQALDGCKEATISQYTATPRKQGTCEINIDAVNRISLKLFERMPLPGEIHLHDVPILCLDSRDVFIKRWDFVIEQILILINGVNNVLAIGKSLNAEPGLIIKGLRQLLHYRCITLIDTFQFTNRYTATPDIHKLAKDKSLKKKCVEYCTSSIQMQQSSQKRPSQKHNMAVVLLKLYAALSVEKTVQEFALKHDLEERGICVQQFIVFGVVHGFIRRVHEYPICRDRNHDLFNGTHHMDYICCKKQMSRKDVLRSLKETDHTIIFK